MESINAGEADVEEVACGVDAAVVADEAREAVEFDGIVGLTWDEGAGLAAPEDTAAGIGDDIEVFGSGVFGKVDGAGLIENVLAFACWGTAEAIEEGEAGLDIAAEPGFADGGGGLFGADEDFQAGTFGWVIRRKAVGVSGDQEIACGEADGGDGFAPVGLDEDTVIGETSDAAGGLEPARCHESGLSTAEGDFIEGIGREVVVGEAEEDRLRAGIEPSGGMIGEGEACLAGRDKCGAGDGEAGPIDLDPDGLLLEARDLGLHGGTVDDGTSDDRGEKEEGDEGRQNDECTMNEPTKRRGGAVLGRRGTLGSLRGG